MTGIEKILEHIKSDADSQVDQILSQAKQEVKQIIETAEIEGKDIARLKSEQAKLEYQAIINKGISAAVLKEKRLILEEKQQIIENVIYEAMNSLVNLSCDDYFDTIIKMVKKYALSNKEGLLLFSESDLNRLPADFNDRIAIALKDRENAVLMIAKETRVINGGFVLKYGDIEENCSFEAIFAAEKETLQDKVGRLLFA